MLFDPDEEEKVMEIQRYIIKQDPISLPEMVPYTQGAYCLYSDHLKEKDAIISTRTEVAHQLQDALSVRDRQIATLTAEKDKLKEALGEIEAITDISQHPDILFSVLLGRVQWIARTALGQIEPNRAYAGQDPGMPSSQELADIANRKALKQTEPDCCQEPPPRIECSLCGKVHVEEHGEEKKDVSKMAFDAVYADKLEQTKPGGDM